MAKRGDFENGLKAAEEAIGALGKKTDAMEKPAMSEVKEEKKDDNSSVEKSGHNGTP